MDAILVGGAAVVVRLAGAPVGEIEGLAGDPAPAIAGLAATGLLEAANPVAAFAGGYGELGGDEVAFGLGVDGDQAPDVLDALVICEASRGSQAHGLVPTRPVVDGLVVVPRAFKANGPRRCSGGQHTAGQRGSQ